MSNDPPPVQSPCWADISESEWETILAGISLGDENDRPRFVAYDEAYCLSRRDCKKMAQQLRRYFARDIATIHATDHGSVKDAVMRPEEATRLTGFDKCTFDPDDTDCESCGKHNVQLFSRRTDQLSVDLEYFCEACMIKEAWQTLHILRRYSQRRGDTR